ncbi:hypothetical protein SERLA73DRAFT_114994 [Serpula lacrymans var. lacrymans S7.3]|uniref:ATP-dependent DNA helicase II subunit 2 n=2 Tax=Serpula lacrymans var. lacrymans TaxID=341189 RepID=F8QBW7_SERL3|nr:hypothetical protein SERLA73DRAFT_114994 [Serpula lacrymans var. lacrymans S7.3]
MGTCALALQEISRPEIKQVKSTLMGTVIRLGDVDGRPDEAIEVLVKASKCTALTRPKGWKKFASRQAGDDEYEGGEEDEDRTVSFAQLKMRTEYYIDHGEHEDEDDESEDGDKSPTGKDENSEKVEKEQLIRGFKYGTTYAPCPDGQFPRLPTQKGMDICGFFQARNFRRELAMGEVQYIWADPSSAQQQVALSSIVQAMYEKDVLAIARWVTKDGMDPKMGVLAPSVFDKIDCLLWVQMPFADDVRKYNFASLDYLMSKKGERIMKHPYIPTDDQLSAMENFVDAMDLMDAGDKDEEGNRYPWFDTRLSYNPAVHRTKQALFHSAVVNDLITNPIPPPHPELLKYFEPPKKVLKRARDAIEDCKQAFKVKEVPKKVARARKDGHVRARDEDEDMLLLDIKMPKRMASQAASQILNSAPGEASPSKPTKPPPDSDTETEDEDEEELLLDKKPDYKGHALPTPSRSLSPPVEFGRAPGRIIGTTYPLQDFKKNIAQGDLVSKAVEDMGVVIKDIVMKPFSSRRHDELLDCLKTLREISLKEDEIDAWNEFLQDLKKSCISYPGNQEFWTQVQKLGRDISLISTSEANKLGGISTVSDTAATEVSSRHVLSHCSVN